VLSPNRPPDALNETTSVQSIADAGRGAVPRFNEEPAGKGTVESFTVIYDRDGEVKHGVVMLRTAENDRTLARISAGDRPTLARLLDMDRTPIGSSGAIAKAADGMPEWRAALLLCRPRGKSAIFDLRDASS